MTDTAPNADRKRRRWLIAGAVLVVACSVGWWYWPRGDARLVGTWAVQHRLAGFPRRDVGEVTFLANGQVRVAGEGFGFAPAQWDCRDNLLLLDGRFGRLPTWMYDFTLSHSDWIPVSRDAWVGGAWTIESVSETSIEVWNATNPLEAFHLTRLPR